MLLSKARETFANRIRDKVAGTDRKERADLIWRTPGERWFTNADPITRVNGAPTMYIGGIRALLLQSLHPLAMAGVAGHSGYQDDPWGRLQRTADYVATTTFARKVDVEEMIAHVRRIHGYIKGRLPDGRAYAASDPHLLKWVHCAEIESFLIAHQRFGSKPLTPAECDTYVAQTAISARMLGVVDPPQTVEELYKTLASYGPELEFSTATADVVDLLVDNPPLDVPMKWGYDMLKVGAIALLPSTARTMLGLGGSADSNRVSFSDEFWRRPVARAATFALQYTLGQVRLSEEVEAAALKTPYSPLSFD
ncbi:MAG: oxygenase MpaB family protein [Actinomycetaceae bacterium]|nr:oxygenase MpaB family protein [Actinomycetaceae bacterium]